MMLANPFVGSASVDLPNLHRYTGAVTITRVSNTILDVQIPTGIQDKYITCCVIAISQAWNVAMFRQYLSYGMDIYTSVSIFRVGNTFESVENSVYPSSDDAGTSVTCASVKRPNAYYLSVTASSTRWRVTASKYAMWAPSTQYTANWFYI